MIGISSYVRRSGALWPSLVLAVALLAPTPSEVVLRRASEAEESPGNGRGADLHGRSWTPVDPRSVGRNRYRDVAGLPDANSGEYLAVGKITDPAGITVKSADSVAYSEKLGRKLRGGLIEFLIPNSRTQVRVTQTLSLAPAY